MLQHKNTVARINLLTICCVIYLILAVGRVIPYDSEDSAKGLIGGLVFFAVAAYAISNKHSRFSLQLIGGFTCIAVATFAIGSLKSSNIGYLIDKIHGGILSTTACSALFCFAYKKYGIEKIHAAILKIALAVLLATVLYKSKAGLFDRDVRFLINGPIVYGWLAGFFSLMALNTWQKTNKKVYLAVGLTFIAAVLWTQSKGPLAALLITLIYLNKDNIVAHKLKFLVLFISAIFLIFANFEFIESTLSETRLSVITRIISGQLQDSDEGSIGSRGDLLEVAKQKFQENPLTGIGLGEFKHDGFKYPHNQHVEIATELGFFAALLHLGFIAVGTIRSNRYFRALILFFSIAGLFSGDISYLRFLYTSIIIGIFTRHLIPQEKQ